jgi:hypothetical protein
MDFNHNELLAKVVFALFATMSLLISKGHASSTLLSLEQEKAVRMALQKELQLQDPELKVTFFRCHTQSESCQVVIHQGSGVKSICDIQSVTPIDFKRNAYAILDTFYFNQIKDCL